MRLHKSQLGFSALHILLLIVLFSIIGFAGWRVYEANEPTKPTASYNTQATSTQKPAASKIPDDFVEYENKELGFKFAYPKEWGNVNIKPGRETKYLAAGSEYELSFTKNAQVTAGVLSKDAKQLENMGHGGSVSAEGYANTLATDFKQPGQYENSSNTNNSFIIGGTFIAESCAGMGHLLVHNLGESKTYPSVAFLYFDTVNGDDPNSDQINNACYVDNGYAKFLSVPHLEELKKIDSTITTLN